MPMSKNVSGNRSIRYDSVLSRIRGIKFVYHTPLLPRGAYNKLLHPVRLSVPCLRFSRNRKAVETSNLVET